MPRDDVRTIGEIVEGHRGDSSLEVALFTIVCVVEDKRRVAFPLLVHTRLVAKLVYHEGNDRWSAG